jgi:hypothetical protein
MTKQRNVDPDAPPTSIDDWRHAHARRPTRRHPPKPPVAGGLTLHVFQASTNERLFVVTDGTEPSQFVDCPDDGLWLPFKALRETGEQRIGLSETAARRDIGRRGFHLIDLAGQVRKRPLTAVKKTGLAEGRGRFARPSASRSSPRSTRK